MARNFEQLPIDESLPLIEKALNEGSCLVLTASPGAGKSTRVPPFVSKFLGNAEVWILEPRRIAARSLAKRIADEMGSPLGQEVGYQVRFEKQSSDKTKILFLTEALFLRKLISNPELKGVGAVILDEFHERNLNTDMALCLVKEIQESIRPDLKIIVMSATLNAQKLLGYLEKSKLIESKGKIYPLEEVFLSKSLDLTDIRNSLKDEILSALKKAIAFAAKSDRRNILVFLPGMAEIKRSVDDFSDWLKKENYQALALHGSLDLKSQSQVLESDAAKVIFSTNVAETSLTIDGVSVVIDSGLVRNSYFDADLGFERLSLEKISKFSAIQRAGRAARQGPGLCLKLFSEQEYLHFVESTVAEIERSQLESSLLLMQAWRKAKLESIPWFEKPKDKNLSRAIENLILWKAVEEKSPNLLTKLGENLLTWPFDLRLSYLCQDLGQNGLKDLGVLSAVLLTEADPLVGASDLWDRLEFILERKHPYLTLAQKISPISPKLDSKSKRALHMALLKSFPERLAKRRGAKSQDALLSSGRGALLNDDALRHGGEFFIALKVRDSFYKQAKVARVEMAEPVTLDEIEEALDTKIKSTLETKWTNGRFQVFEQKKLDSLELSQAQPKSIDLDALILAVMEHPNEIFNYFLKENVFFAKLDLRIQYAKKYMGFESEWNAQSFAKILEDYLSLQSTPSQPQSWDLRSILLDYAQTLDLRMLDRELPESVVVPSGRSIDVEYKADLSAPKISVRLQEIFGWLESPTLAKGKIKIAFELLSPGYKPVQTTSDLNSFWKQTYPVLKKELKIQYPKHSWPEDPLTAKAVAKGSSKKR